MRAFDGGSLPDHFSRPLATNYTSVSAERTPRLNSYLMRQSRVAWSLSSIVIAFITALLRLPDLKSFNAWPMLESSLGPLERDPVAQTSF
jgi:hypothetical protein